MSTNKPVLLQVISAGRVSVEPDAPQCRTATIYAGLNEWGLRGLG
ncbi:hypothetical protein ACWD4V_31055 [Streptomyces tsukubensis]